MIKGGNTVLIILLIGVFLIGLGLSFPFRFNISQTDESPGNEDIQFQPANGDGFCIDPVNEGQLCCDEECMACVRITEQEQPYVGDCVENQAPKLREDIVCCNPAGTLIANWQFANSCVGTILSDSVCSEEIVCCAYGPLEEPVQFKWANKGTCLYGLPNGIVAATDTLCTEQDGPKPEGSLTDTASKVLEFSEVSPGSHTAHYFFQDYSSVLGWEENPQGQILMPFDDWHTPPPEGRLETPPEDLVCELFQTGLKKHVLIEEEWSTVFEDIYPPNPISDPSILDDCDFMQMSLLPQYTMEELPVKSDYEIFVTDDGRIHAWNNVCLAQNNKQAVMSFSNTICPSQTGDYIQGSVSADLDFETDIHVCETKVILRNDVIPPIVPYQTKEKVCVPDDSNCEDIKVCTGIRDGAKITCDTDSNCQNTFLCTKKKDANGNPLECSGFGDPVCDADSEDVVDICQAMGDCVDNLGQCVPKTAFFGIIDPGDVFKHSPNAKASIHVDYGNIQLGPQYGEDGGLQEINFDIVVESHAFRSHYQNNDVFYELVTQPRDGMITGFNSMLEQDNFINLLSTDQFESLLKDHVNEMEITEILSQDQLAWVKTTIHVTITRERELKLSEEVRIENHGEEPVFFYFPTEGGEYISEFSLDAGFCQELAFQLFYENIFEFFAEYLDEFIGQLLYELEQRVGDSGEVIGEIEIGDGLKDRTKVSIQLDGPIEEDLIKLDKYNQLLDNGCFVHN